MTTKLTKEQVMYICSKQGEWERLHKKQEYEKYQKELEINRMYQEQLRRRRGVLKKHT